MSLISRLFGKAPATVGEPPAPAQDPPSPAAAPEPDRKAIAEQEERELRSALESGDLMLLSRFVLEGASTRVRQAAAQAIEDPAVIRRLIKDVRGGNDKSVYRILTAKRDAHLSETRRTEQLHAEIAATAAALEKHSHRHYDALFSPTLDQLELRWNAVAEHAAPEIRENARRAIDTAREVIARHLRDVAAAAARELASANAAALEQRLREEQERAAAAAAAERDAALEAQRREESAQREARILLFRQLGGLLRKAQLALGEGSTGRAAGLRRAIEEKLAGAPPLPAHLSSQIQQLDARLNELKDWKSFTVTPKRTELMEEMESLVGADLEPQVLADRIRGLQEQWRTLSKGAGENLEADWQRFQEAAHKAYEPCREYFEAQSKARQENLRNREALLQRLESFETRHDWLNPDWRTVAVALRESRQLWRAHSPVDRAAGRPLQQRFDELTGRLQQRLDAEHARNAGEKQLLIERARLLGTLEDTRRAVDDLKELQRRWQAVGPVAREQDRPLWEEFRRHCDVVFERRQQQSAEFAAALETNKAQALDLCARLEAIAALQGTELLSAAAGIAGMRAEFEAIGPFPKADSRDLQRRFERAMERCERAAERQRALDKEQGWTDLLEAANRVRRYRLAAGRGAAVSELEELRSGATSFMESLKHVPRGGREALSEALARTDDNDLQANEKALRMLCIRAEILSDQPTAAEDQVLRREYQVQRLVQSMGQGIGREEGQMDAVTLEWVRIGPTEDEVYDTLVARLLHCRKQGAAIS